jgi:hypothetical protein
MKFWSIAYPDENGNEVVETLSDAEIIATYWDYWYGKMCEKYGKDHVDTHYCKQDCIDDWVIGHWAWESTND